MTRILLTNDDGFFAPGIRAMREALLAAEAPMDIIVIAPDREQSASSHGMTLHRPLRLDQVEPEVYKVDGTPTDCVLLAARGGLPVPPDLVISGINSGRNMGDDVTYSGTVAAAMEGTLLGMPSLAVSLAGDRYFDTAASVAARLMFQVLDRGLPPDTFLNVNVPDLPLADVRGALVTAQSRRTYHDQVISKRDPRGRAYYWIAGDVPEGSAADGTDFAAVQEGYVSITPLHLDLTNHAAMDDVRSWRLTMEGR